MPIASCCLPALLSPATQTQDRHLGIALQRVRCGGIYSDNGKELVAVIDLPQLQKQKRRQPDYGP